MVQEKEGGDSGMTCPYCRIKMVEMGCYDKDWSGVLAHMVTYECPLCLYNNDKEILLFREKQ